MKIAIVGSRQCDAQPAVEYLISSLAAKDPNTTIVSGGARGVDSWAAEAAKRAGLKVETYLPDWQTHGKGAGFIRNTVIVEESDKVIAFWDGMSTGTQDTIRKAQSVDKLAKVFMVKSL